MALIGYVKKHPSYSLKNQKEILRGAGCEIIFEETSVRENVELLKALEIYKEGKDIFLTLLHRNNDLVQPQFLAVLELKKREQAKRGGRPKKRTEDVEQIAVRLLERGLSNKEVCEIVDISQTTLTRIKESNLLRY